MSTDNGKRSAHNACPVSKDGRGGRSSPAPKRLKTNVTATDPVLGVVLNPDTLSKVLRYIDIPDVPPVSRTCKIWNQILVPMEQTLWKGLVARHNPTLVQITDMLPDDVGEGQARKTMKAQSDGTTITLPPPSKNWKDQMKRQMILKNSDYEVHEAPLKDDIDSYVFEIRYKVKLETAADDLIVEAIDLKAASIFARRFIRPLPVTIPNSVTADAVEVLSVDVIIIDKTTGRQAALATGSGTVGDFFRIKRFVPKQFHDENIATADCLSRQIVQTAKIDNDGVSWALTISIEFLVKMCEPNRGAGRQVTSAYLESYQLLRFLQHDLTWI